MLAQNQLRKITAKTAAYQILPADIGVLFTNRGATAVFNFTLPPTADLQAGWWCRFFVTDADGIAVISLGSNDDIVAPNDTDADSITMSTASLTIGASLEVIWDGTDWLAFRGGFGTYAVA